MSAPITTYQNVNFYKRVEARWAAFFTAIRATWTYEPMRFSFLDGTRYSPDFALTLHNTRYYVEVNLESATYAQPLLVRLAREHKVNVLSIIGHPHENTYQATLISVDGIKPRFETVYFQECVKCGQIGFGVCGQGWKNSPKIKAALQAARSVDFGGAK